MLFQEVASPCAFLRSLRGTFGDYPGFVKASRMDTTATSSGMLRTLLWPVA